jgi:probable phosphoglycerate mutase
MAIYLVRHAETDANAARVVQRPDVPLSARGREQAARLARRLADAGVAHVVTSDARRALETAAVVRDVTGAPMTVDPDLAERNYGDIRGTPYSELVADIFAPDYEPPGGETWAAFHARVDAVWARMLVHAGGVPGHVAVVTHGLVCEAVLHRHLGGRPEPGFRRWTNTSITVIEPPRTIRLLACAAHLDDVADTGPV